MSYCKDHAIQGFVNQGPTVHKSTTYNILLFMFDSFIIEQMGRGGLDCSGLKYRGIAPINLNEICSILVLNINRCVALEF